jgi:hypothetical protein
MPTFTGTNSGELIAGTSGDDTIFGLGGNDTLQGLAGNDTLDGGSGNDILTGGPGIDTLTGGTGADTFLDTAAGLNGDTITDFSLGDRIQITDLTKENGNIQIVGNTITYAGGSVTVDGLANLSGRIAIRDIQGGGVEIRLQPLAHTDFNGDGISDLMFREAGGTMSEWLGQGSSGAFAWNPNAGFQVGTDWSMLGFGDFNADGMMDILWRQSTTGKFMVWDGKADGTFAWAVNYDLPTSYTFAGIGDFNGDGHSDIMWRDASGTLSEWLGQSNGSFAWNPNAAFQLSTDWQLASSSDFNGDGYGDLVWRSSTSGQVMEWLGQPDGTFAWSTNYDLSNNFHLAGTGDFNGDGIADLMWRDSSGNLSEWLGQANGGFAWNPNAIYNMSNDWELAATGDYNHDGTDDLIWRSDSTGQVIEWLGQSDGTFVVNQNVHYNVGTNFHIQPPSDHFL